MHRAAHDFLPPPDRSATIVCAHGAIVNGWEMVLFRRRLRALGYRVRQFQYRSMTRGLAENVEALRAFVAATEGKTVHLVGHSMGGVLIRRAFEEKPPERPGRLVAIGSPLLDCWIARAALVRHRFLRHRVIGRTVGDFLREPSAPLWTGTGEFGVIAGTLPLGVGSTYRAMPRPNDGVVLWEETRLAGVTDHATYRINHFGLLLSRRCLVQTAYFLAHGRFRPDAGTLKSESLRSIAAPSAVRAHSAS